MPQQNSDNPEQIPKHHTIQEYINDTLQLKTLKIKKFDFQNSFSCEVKSSKRLRNSLTTREHLNELNESQQFNDFKKTGWQPKLSYRKLMKEPKVLLSVERRKTKTSQSVRRANSVFTSPKIRVGFRGQKVKSQSFYIDKNQQKTPKRLIIQNNFTTPEKKYKQIPNFHFNFKYVIDQRKKGNEHLSIEQKTKKGSNQGYFAFFQSANFTKYLQKNLYHSSHPRTKTSIEKKTNPRKKQIQQKPQKLQSFQNQQK